MRVGPEGTLPCPHRTTTPPAPAASNSIRSAPASPLSRPGSAPLAMPQDRVEHRQTAGANGFGGAGNWAMSEWSTLAAAAHGLASAPGVVSQSWHDAAQTNEQLAHTIRHAVGEWNHESASTRQAAIDILTKTAAPASKSASALARELAQANRLPLAIEEAVNTAVAGLPGGAQQTVKQIARFASSPIDKLAAPIEARAQTAARNFEIAASVQTHEASKRMVTLSRTIGTTFVDAHRALKGNENVGKLLAKVPLLRDTPVVGFLLTGVATQYDIANGKSIADAGGANVVGTLAGSATGAAITKGLASSVARGAIADLTAEALGAAVATGPAGWAVAGGVIGGAAVGYGIYKIVESKPGQDVIDGLTQLNKRKIASGIGEAQSDLLSAGEKARDFVVSSVKVPYA